jgi:hypothetical protein
LVASLAIANSQRTPPFMHQQAAQLAKTSIIIVQQLFLDYYLPGGAAPYPVHEALPFA